LNINHPIKREKKFVGKIYELKTGEVFVYEDGMIKPILKRRFNADKDDGLYGLP